MPLNQPTEAIRPPIENLGTFDGGIWFIMTIIFAFIIGFMLIYIILLKWFGSSQFVAKDAWRKKCAIIQHFETGKNAILKLAKVEGNAFRHEKIEDGTVTAMPNGVSLIGSKLWINTWALFGASVPPSLLAGIALLKNLGFNSVEEIKKHLTMTENDMTKLQENVPAQTREDIVDFNSVILKGYDFSDFNKLISQTEKRFLIPLSIEDVPNFIKKSINPHDTEDIINREVDIQVKKMPSNDLATFAALGMFMLFTSLGFVVIYNTISGA